MTESAEKESYHAAYYAANKAKIKARVIAWRAANRERAAAYNKEYKQAYMAAHRDKIAAQNRAYRARKPEVYRQATARQRALHPEKAAARAAVTNAILRGNLPAAKTLICACGAPALEYHHHLGYAPEHALDVIAVCHECHTEAHK